MKLITFLSLLSPLIIPTPIKEKEIIANQASGQTSGEGIMFTGKDPYDLTHTSLINGSLSFNIIDNGDRGSPLQNIDEVHVEAIFQGELGEYQIIIKEPMISDPGGKYPTWFGVGYDKKMHGKTNTRTNKLPKMEPNVAIYGWSDLYLNGTLIKTKAHTQVTISTKPTFTGVILEVETEKKSIPNVTSGYLHVQWPKVDELNLLKNRKKIHRWAGASFLIGLNAWFGYLSYINKPKKEKN